MMLPQKLKKLLDDWPSKLISLIVAILIYVFYQISILETKNMAVPLVVEENGSLRAVSLSDKNVHVSIKGLKEDIVSLEAVDFKTYIDINSFVDEGEYEVPVKVQLSENALMVENLEVKVSPAKVNVSVTEYASSYVPVIPSVSGTPLHGYELGDVVIDPPSVKIYGPKKIVESIDKLESELISVNDRSESFVMDAEVLCDNKMIEFPENSYVSVSVSLSESILEKTYAKVPVAVLTPSEPYFVENAEFYTKVTLRGSVLNLENFVIPRNTFYADCSSLKEEGNYVIPIKNYRIRNGEVINVFPSEISVKISKVVEPEPEVIETNADNLAQAEVVESVTEKQSVE